MLLIDTVEAVIFTVIYPAYNHPTPKLGRSLSLQQLSQEDGYRTQKALFMVLRSGTNFAVKRLGFSTMIVVYIFFNSELCILIPRVLFLFKLFRIKHFQHPLCVDIFSSRR